MTDKDHGATGADKQQAKPDASGATGKVSPVKDTTEATALPGSAASPGSTASAASKAVPAAAHSAVDKKATAQLGAGKNGDAKSGDPKSGETKKSDTKKTAAAGTPAAAKKGGAWKWPFIGGFVIGVVILAAGAVGAVVTRDLWLPYLPLPETSEAVEVAAFAAVEERVARLEAVPTQEAVDELQQGVESLGAEIEILSQRLTAAEDSDADRLAAVASEVTGLEARFAELDRRLESLASEPSAPAVGLEARIAELEALAGVAPTPGADPEAVQRLTRAFADLEGRLAARESDVGTLAALESQMASLEQAIAAVARGSAGSSALALAALQLRDALRGSAPYATELQVLRGLAGDDAVLNQRLDPLAGHAETGLPSLADLEAAFPAVAAAAVGADRGLAEQGWVAGALRRVSELVSIRRVGMVEGDAADAIVARAEVKLREGDLAGTLAELATLEGPAAEAVAAWRGKAEARLAAGRAVTELGALLAERARAARGDG